MRRLRAGRGAVGRARRRLGPLGRRAAGRGRRADRALADEADPRDRPRQRPHLRRAGRDQRRTCRPPSAPEFFYPPDPSSQIVCSIGGNVAENSGGAHCFKYGFTTNYVTGLEVVLPDGELIQLGGYELDPPGLRPARRVRRLRGHARRRHQGLAAGRPLAGDGPDAGRVLRLHARGRRGGVGDRAGRRRAGRDRDDGREGDRGRRADGPRRLPDARRGAAGRARRRRARVRRRASTRSPRSASATAPTTCGWRATRPSASGSGRRARRRSPRWAGSRPTTSCRTA